MGWLKNERFYLSVLLLLILIMAVRTPLDSDMWWHLRAGEETQSSGNIYRVDTFSYTKEGGKWINHSWLAQVVMFGLFQMGNYQAIALWVGITAMISMLFVYQQMEGHAILRMGITLLASFVCSVVWTPRPQIFSLLLFGLTGLILYRFKWQGKRQLFLLIPIFIVWSNLHAGYVLGIILIGAYVVGEGINQIFGQNPNEQLGWNDIRNLGLWALAGFIVAAINPNGIDMWRIPFQTVGVESLQQLIQEWASPDFHQPLQQLMLLLLFGTFAAVGISKKRLDGSDLVNFAFFGFLALVARRNFGPFAMVAAPILSRHLSSMNEEFQTIMANWPPAKKVMAFQEKSNQSMRNSIQTGINLIVILLLIATSGYKVYSVTKKDFIEKMEYQLFPAGAVDWLNENQPEGRLFNTYNWGGYLIWKLRGYQVFIDGRTDLYGDEIIEEWESIVNAKNGWEDSIDYWNVKIILLDNELPLGKILSEKGWKVEYRDNLAVIFTSQ